jgi:hypothetical protein
MTGKVTTMSFDHPTEDEKTVNPQEVLAQLLIELRAYSGVVGAWADMLTCEIYQELRPQAIEALRNCAKNMQLSYDEIRDYLQAQQVPVPEPKHEQITR